MLTRVEHGETWLLGKRKTAEFDAYAQTHAIALFRALERRRGGARCSDNKLYFSTRPRPKSSCKKTTITTCTSAGFDLLIRMRIRGTCTRRRLDLDVYCGHRYDLQFVPTFTVRLLIEYKHRLPTTTFGGRLPRQTIFPRRRLHDFQPDDRRRARCSGLVLFWNRKPMGTGNTSWGPSLCFRTERREKIL